jgi:hypothetical protein
MRVTSARDAENGEVPVPDGTEKGRHLLPTMISLYQIRASA